MRKLIAILTAVVFMTLAASVALADMTADEIITKYLESTGGVENYKNLKSTVMQGKAFMQQQPFDIYVANRAPDQFYMKFSSDMMQIINATDGKQAWQLLSPFVEGYIFMEGDDLQRMIEQGRMNPYLDYKERGGKMTLLGEEPVKGSDCFKIEYIKPSGDTSHLFISKDNFHLMKESSNNGSVLYAKHKEVDGFDFPHKLTMMQQGQRIMMIVNSIEVNPELPDSLFTPPADSLKADPAVVEQMRKAQQQQMEQQQGSEEEKTKGEGE